MKINIIISIIGKLYGLLNKKQKVYLLILILLTFALSIIETVGISVIMPFISVTSNPEILDGGMYKRVYDFLNFTEKNRFIIFFGIAIIIFYVFRAVFNIAHSYFLNRFSQSIYRNFSGRLFTSFMNIPYTVYAQKNSGEIIQIIYGISRESATLTLNILQLLSELATILLIYAVIIMLNWKMTLVITVILIALVLLFLNIIITKSKVQGAKQTAATLNLHRSLVKTISNFKFIRLKGNQNGIIKNYNSQLEVFSKAQIVNAILGSVPKIVLESLGFSLLVAAIIAILLIYNDASQVIPIISMYALALYRILPSINRMLHNINMIAFGQKSLDIINESLHQNVEHEGPMPVTFNEKIRLENVSFKYLTGGAIFDSVSLEIRKGEKIAITGESGCGKSTLVDLIIGILKPVSGSLYIDDTLISDENIRGWRKQIGYIPQSIYLFDGTVAENVTIGSDYDAEKIINVLKMANIWDFLQTKEGMHTKVGEKGIQLSGGQQQRIGIARALYDDPEILVLDEATSALDNETEAKIMDEIYSASGNKTLIVIAHRMDSIKRCQRGIRIENGKIV